MADGENDPADIPRLIDKLDEGFELVSGWRTGRWMNSRFTRRIPSVAANSLISWMTGVKMHDYGCTLKAYRRDLAQNLMLYGEMHRFVPAIAVEQGARIAEIQVGFRPSTFRTLQVWARPDRQNDARSNDGAVPLGLFHSAYSGVWCDWLADGRDWCVMDHYTDF